MEVRVRYAPSPTGLQHIGGIRTALFNFFFARSQGGKFLLRIEDTDQERYSDASLQDLYDTLAWLGVDWDEGPLKGGPCGPYVQSERFEIYREYAERLVEQGQAYRCFCTAERLEALREEQQRTKSSEQGYDRHCRHLTSEQVAELQAAGIPSVIRLKVPREGKTTFTDILMGDISRKNTDVSPDPVLLKSDGFPTYHLANVIDDHLMGITHIMRAQEWIPSGPLHILLYRAFGWEPPLYCHLPMVMGKDGQKLSKRHGSTAVRDFKAAGYLPEAVVNYVCLLGWSYDGETEFFSAEELKKVFTLERISKSPGVFDYKKLEWFNGQYIRKLTPEVLLGYLIPILQKDGVVDTPPTVEQQGVLEKLVPLVQERLKVLNDITEMTRFLFQEIETPEAEALIPKKTDAATTLQILERAGRILTDDWDQSDERLEELFHGAAEELGVKLGAMLMPVRIAVTGSSISPPLFDSLRALGSSKTSERITRSIQRMKEEVAGK